MIKRIFIALIVVACAQLASATTVEISSGGIAGMRKGHIDQYLGVPYAAPPIGELRWRAPQPVASWPGIRPALAPASPCAQIGSFYSTDNEASFDKPYGSEDCLYLNVWAPASPKELLPVLVFFHGGSGIVGDSAHPLYNGQRLAEEANAVVVTANYRLGVFGSLQSPALHTGDPAEDSGSYFLLDMIRVLDWLSENCLAFGCDSKAITISGQSAGAVSVLALLRSPLAQGKFQGAISFSGLPFSASTETALKRTEKLLSHLASQNLEFAVDGEGVDFFAGNATTQMRDYLYQLSTGDLLNASGFGLSPAIVADGTVLASLETPDKPVAKALSRVPLMIGGTKDEMTTLTPIKGFGRSAEKIWPLVNGEPRDKTINQQLGFFSGLVRDVRVGFANLFVKKRLKKYSKQYAKQLPAVYLYQFAWADYPEPWRSEMGAFHGLDIPFIFGNFIDDHKIYMRFAWTEENKKQREALHSEIVQNIYGFLRKTMPGNRDADNYLWAPLNDRENIHIWK
ncbi:carboxylesterase family protein [Zhongshania aliphaticivorans]|uniref:carboxylesterase family protein n=1 Tax=Zhongshania aliphaticivorans TaxID=1470434 RepID=UPI0039C90598